MKEFNLVVTGRDRDQVDLLLRPVDGGEEIVVHVTMGEMIGLIAYMDVVSGFYNYQKNPEDFILTEHIARLLQGESDKEKARLRRMDEEQK